MARCVKQIDVSPWIMGLACKVELVLAGLLAGPDLSDFNDSRLLIGHILEIHEGNFKKIHRMILTIDPNSPRIPVLTATGAFVDLSKKSKTQD